MSRLAAPVAAGQERLSSGIVGAMEPHGPIEVPAMRQAGRRLRLGMASRMLLAFAALILPLAAISGNAYRSSIDDRRDAALVESVHTAQTAATAIQGLLRGLDGTALAMAAALGQQPGQLDQASVGSYLLSVSDRYPIVRQILLVDPGGRVIAAALPEMVGMDVSNRPSVRAVQDGQEFVLSDVLQSPLTGEPVIDVARAIPGVSGGRRGVLLISFYPSRFSTIFPGSLPNGASLSVLDHRGALVFSDNRNTLLAEPRETQVQAGIAEALAGRVATLHDLRSADGERHLGVVAPVPDYGWAVSLTRTERAVEGPLQDFYRRQVFVIAMVTAGALALALIVSRTLSRPLTRLAAQARAYSIGRPTFVASNGPPEVETLAEALNTMAAQVQQRFLEREAAERRLAFLLDASTQLAGSLDYQETLAALTRLVVPELADWCTVHVLEPDNSVRRIAVSHIDPERLRLLEELRVRYPLQLGSPHPVAQVLRTGEPVFHPDVTEETLRGFAQDDAHAAHLQRLLRSFIAVPLTARTVTFGVLVLAMENPGPRYDQTDLALAQILARRAALAVENARLYDGAQASLAEAKTALAIREEFLSIASHELRTPLTALKSNLQLARRRLARGTPPEQVADLVDHANAQTERLTGLVSDLLDVTRIAAGRLLIERGPVAIGPLLHRIVELERAADPERVITLAVPEGELTIDADAARLEQVLLNLIENARKYSPPQCPIHVRSRLVGDALSIEVEDQGIGVPPEDQEHIFDRFHRATNVDKGVTGLGLGLHIAREIIRAHGGTLTVQSTAGHGSTFTITLPLGSAAGPDLAPRDLPVTPQSTE